MTETWEPAEYDMQDYWQTAIGGSYTPAKLGKHQSAHPTTVKRVLDEVRGTEVADVIVGLVFWAAIVRNREEALTERIFELEAAMRGNGQSGRKE